jgi:PAS domain S-box-containing protein
MAQRTAGHFANPAAVKGTGFRNYARFRDWKIGTFLAACFAAIVLLMIVGDVIAVLQLNRVETRAARFYQADQKSLAVMHVYLDVVTVRDTLTASVHEQDPHEFASRATALRDNFLRDVTRAQRTLSSAPDVSQDPTILIRLETVRAALPSQVDTFLELVKVEDWQAIRFRLVGQVQPLIALSSSLVADVEQEVAQERARALESVQRTRRQLYLVLTITALLILFMAALLGWYATRRISRSLEKLDAGAQALARGEFGYEIELSGNDELADLARAFNRAAQQLQKFYDDIKRSEAYLAESNARLEEAQRITHVGYWEWDLATSRVKWSDETYRIYGMQPQERPMDLATLQEKIPPEDWERCMEVAYGGSARYSIEYRVLRPTGEVRIVHTRGEVKKDASGRPYQMFGTVQDITDRKRAEDALRKSEKELRDVIDTIPAMVWTALPDGSNAYVNRRFIEYSGMSVEQMGGSGWQALIHPDDLERHAAKWAEAVATGKPHENEVRFRRSDGQYRCHLDRGVPLRDEDGNIVKWYGVVTDIEDLKRAKEALESMSRDLQESKTRLETAQRIAHVGYWAWDGKDGLTWSDETYRIYGLRPQERPMNVEAFQELIHPEDREILFRAIQEARGGGLPDIEYRIIHPSGEVRIVHAVTRDMSGQPYQMFGIVQDITDRKRAEQRLRESEAYLAEAQRLSQTGSWAWNPATGDIRYWSEMCFSMLGFDPAGPLPRFEEFVHRIHADDQAVLMERFDKAIHDKADFELDYRVVHPQKGIRDIHVVGHAVLDVSGNLDEFVGTVIDVTERKCAEEALQKSQLYLTEGQRLAHMGSWAFNATGFSYWSSELLRIYGLDPAGKPPTVEEYLALVHPEDRAFMKQGIAKMLDDHLAFDFTKRIVRPDGEIRRVRCVGVPVTQGETFQGFLGTGMDVTEQDRLTEELRLSQSHLAEAQKLTHTGSWVWRVPDRNAVHLSEEWYRIYGFDPDKGAPAWEQRLARVHPEDRLKWKGTIERAIVEKADYDLEFRILLTNGKVKWIHTVGHPVLSNTGDLEQFVGSSTDITERKSAEQEREKLRQLEADLAHTNRVSTLGEMAASLAHEIKQPIAAAITSANSCIEWLAHEPPNLDRARAAAARIDKYGNRAAEIIDRIRSLYKKAPPQRELVDVNGIIQEMLTLLKGEATRLSIGMCTDLSADLPKIMVDRVQLQQVFMNLMLNGIEAMGDSGGELTVKSELRDGQLQFSVSDTGVGLPMEKMDHIFSAFFTTKPQGSGMGLAISRSIVESHGGRLWATANDGRGAAFHFTLPIEVAEPTHHVA